MMETAGTSVSAYSGEVSFIRYFLAPPAQVFDAWTRPERLRQWWGPEGIHIVTCELEPRPGGAIRLAFRLPDGSVHATSGTYLEVARPDRLRFSETLADGPAEPFVTTVTFEKMGAMTRMTVGQTAARSEPLATAQLTGWLESLTRLSEHLLPM